jgi:transaldolase / glucose-6-phosphate isomerase
LAAIAQRGFHRLILRSSPGLSVFAGRLVHLVGNSSSKEEKGIIPIREMWIADPAILEKHCSECVIRFTGEAATSPAHPQIPSVLVEMEGIEHVVAEIFKWEIATSLACSLMGVNPFEDPDFGDGRGAAMEYIEQISAGKKIATSKPRLVEGNLSLFVEGELRHEISSLSFEQALSSFFELLEEDGYLAIQNYAWNIPEVRTRMTALTGVGAQLGVPAQLVDGPWYLHLLGQCYKGGPRGGLALMITCDPAERVEIPGAGYSFGDLVFALALGDFDAMLRRGRPIVRIHMTGPPARALAELESVVQKALKVGSWKR